MNMALHRLPTHHNRTKSIAILIAASLALGTATAGVTNAAPQQGGIAPPEQGGITPGPEAPAPAPAPQPQPQYNPGPGIVPGPPPGQYEQAPAQPNYENAYNPAPPGPIHAPRATPPVKRKAPPPDMVRVGNFTMPVKQLPNVKDRDKYVNSVNEWAAWGEAEIARFLISIGIPEDEASRRAAATIMGAVAAGGVGGAIAFTATTIIVGIVTIPIGAAIGAGASSIIPTPGGPVGGGLIGAGGGLAVAVGAGSVAALVTALGAGLVGGLIAYTLGAGDKNAHPKKPWEQEGPHRKGRVLANPDGNQFEFEVSPEEAKKMGVPAATYVVNKRGDVSGNIGGIEFGWSAEQAQAPIKALGPAAPAVERAINDGTRTVTDAVKNALPGVVVNWPQEKRPEIVVKEAKGPKSTPEDSSELPQATPNAPETELRPAAKKASPSTEKKPVKPASKAAPAKKPTKKVPASPIDQLTKQVTKQLAGVGAHR